MCKKNTGDISDFRLALLQVIPKNEQKCYKNALTILIKGQTNEDNYIHIFVL